MLRHASRFQAGYVLMHAQGSPKDMQDAPTYEDVVEEVRAFFDQKLEALQELNLPGCGLIRASGLVNPSSTTSL
jgi:dihydropteroate synthase